MIRKKARPLKLPAKSLSFSQVADGTFLLIPYGKKLFTRQILKFSRIFANFFFSFKISKTYIFTLGSLSISDGHLKNTLQNIKQYK